MTQAGTGRTDELRASLIELYNTSVKWRGSSYGWTYFRLQKNLYDCETLRLHDTPTPSQPAGRPI